MLLEFLSKYLRDRKGNKFYAKSHVDAVYTRDGGILGDKIEELENNSGSGATGGDGHTHSNKSILDNITADKVNSWDNKVDKVDGMGLSQENFTTTEKTRLQGLSNYDDTALSERISNVEQDIPKLATKEYVVQEIANSNSLTKEIVDSIPSNDEALDNVIYMLKITDESGNPAGYQQYTKINGVVQFIGDTDIDLAGYAKTDELNAGLESKINKTDIIDNLASSESDKPLSARQGKALKELMDSNNNGAETHINDSSIHITPTDKVKLHEHTNKSLLDSLLSSGNGLKYLADDGTYKELFVKSTTQPSDNNAIWIDTSNITNILLKVFNDGSWNTISGSGGSSGTSITIDDILNATSTNPVQNKVIKKYIDNINTDIENIKTQIKPRVLYNKFKNTELDYGLFKIESMTSSKTSPLTFSNLLYGNMQLSDNNYIILKQGKSYCIQYNLYDTPYGREVLLIDSNLNIINRSSTAKGSFIYKPDNNIEITLAPGVDTTIESEYSSVIVFEIGRETVIDPVEYVNTTQGIEDTPVGHIISHMGTTAPAHYLICDGTEYNITDYPYLAQHFVDQFGSVNYFGGDGTTTFAVPDLRGEFLRGTGTADRDSGSGGEIGEHQDATELPYIGVNTTTTKNLWIDSSIADSGSTGLNPKYADKITYRNGSNALYYSKAGAWAGSGAAKYTTRPTNTSVLYCIKYEPTYFMKNTFAGFNKTTLFEGEANKANTSYDLSDSVKNYDMILVKARLYTEADLNNKTLMIDTDDINISDENGAYAITIREGSSFRGIFFNFSKGYNQLYTHFIQNDLSAARVAITKIIGIKAGGNSNNTTYTDEEIQQMVYDILSDSSTSGNGKYTDEEIQQGVSNILGGVN